MKQKSTNCGDSDETFDEDPAARMRLFDQLPVRLRRFLVEEAAYNYAVTPFWSLRHAPWDEAYLTSTAARNIRDEVLRLYGRDHPQAANAGKLMLTPRHPHRRRR